ncbi:collagen alpha-1(I) chain-like [Indicator indicator]|uniref:collagen alpha-1(I) chain-like n=1 Tax=Indicator indicator TaxID=1002788 RepID=UPI0023DF53C8|nr:collagen alpha-1(I) chain-like [Indicator indicator]
MLASLQGSPWPLTRRQCQSPPDWPRGLPPVPVRWHRDPCASSARAGRALPRPADGSSPCCPSSPADPRNGAGRESGARDWSESGGGGRGRAGGSGRAGQRGRGEGSGAVPAPGSGRAGQPWAAWQGWGTGNRPQGQAEPGTGGGAGGPEAPCGARCRRSTEPGEAVSCRGGPGEAAGPEQAGGEAGQPPGPPRSGHGGAGGAAAAGPPGPGAAGEGRSETSSHRAVLCCAVPYRAVPSRTVPRMARRKRIDPRPELPPPRSAAHPAGHRAPGPGLRGDGLYTQRHRGPASTSTGQAAPCPLHRPDPARRGCEPRGTPGLRARGAAGTGGCGLRARCPSSAARCPATVSGRGESERPPPPSSSPRCGASASPRCGLWCPGAGSVCMCVFAWGSPRFAPLRSTPSRAEPCRAVRQSRAAPPRAGAASPPRPHPRAVPGAEPPPSRSLPVRSFPLRTRLAPHGPPRAGRAPARHAGSRSPPGRSPNGRSVVTGLQLPSAAAAAARSRPHTPAAAASVSAAAAAAEPPLAAPRVRPATRAGGPASARRPRRRPHGSGSRCVSAGSPRDPYTHTQPPVLRPTDPQPDARPPLPGHPGPAQPHTHRWGGGIRGESGGERAARHPPTPHPPAWTGSPWKRSRDTPGDGVAGGSGEQRPASGQRRDRRPLTASGRRNGRADGGLRSLPRDGAACLLPCLARWRLRHRHWWHLPLPRAARGVPGRRGEAGRGGGRQQRDSPGVAEFSGVARALPLRSRPSPAAPAAAAAAAAAPGDGGRALPGGSAAAAVATSMFGAAPVWQRGGCGTRGGSSSVGERPRGQLLSWGWAPGPVGVLREPAALRWPARPGPARPQWPEIGELDVGMGGGSSGGSSPSPEGPSPRIGPGRSEPMAGSWSGSCGTGREAEEEADPAARTGEETKTPSVQPRCSEGSSLTAGEQQRSLHPSEGTANRERHREKGSLPVLGDPGEGRAGAARTPRSPGHVPPRSTAIDVTGVQDVLRVPLGFLVPDLDLDFVAIQEEPHPAFQFCGGGQLQKVMALADLTKAGQTRWQQKCDIS